jgi:DNA polymerase-3 subunit gamma/tau
MIGLADRGLTFDLFEYLITGKIEQVISNLERQHQDGANPLTILQDLINITHLVAKVKIVPETLNDAALSEAEKSFCSRLQENISIAVLSKIWQMLIKGLSELTIAPLQADALEMILIRIAYSANLPTPAEVLDGLKKNSNLDLSVTTPKAQDTRYTSNDVSQQSIVFNTPEEPVSYLTTNKKMMMAYSLKNDVSFAEFKNGFMKIAIADKINNEFLLNLQALLTEATGVKWDIDVTKGSLGETLADKETARDNEEKKDVLELPLVRAIMAEFRGAKIESLTRIVSSENSEDEEDNNSLFEDNIFIDEEN